MKTAINTRTQEEYDALMRLRKEKIWEYLSGDIWGLYGENTCIDFEGNNPAYADIEYYQSQGYTIIPYTEFAKANIVEETDFKALYLEGRELLEKAKGTIQYLLETGNRVSPTSQYDVKKIETFLTKTNVTPNS